MTSDTTISFEYAGGKIIARIGNGYAALRHTFSEQDIATLEQLLRLRAGRPETVRDVSYEAEPRSPSVFDVPELEAAKRRAKSPFNALTARELKLLMEAGTLSNMARILERAADRTQDGTP